MTSLDGLRRAANSWVVPTFALVFAGLIVSSLSGPKEFAALTAAEFATRDLSCLAMVVCVLLMAVLCGPGTWPTMILGSRFMQATGRWSYGIFLWHLPVVLLIKDENGPLSGGVGLVTAMAIVLCVSYALGAASWAFIEAPLMSLLKELSRTAGGARKATKDGHPVEPWSGESAVSGDRTP